MADTLTIVAADPNGNGNDAAIDAVVAKLAPISPNQHVLKRASSLEDINKTVTDVFAIGAVKQVQIVGHGQPGSLSLGKIWTQKYMESEDGPVYVLDGTPYFYGFLEPRKAELQNRKVFILGCAVGGIGIGAAGTALLLDLSVMWSCSVGAPVNVIGPDNFDAATGRFDEQELIVANQGCVGPSPGAKEPQGTGGVETITFISATGAPSLGPNEPQSIDLPTAPTPQGHPDMIVDVLDAPPVIAAPEIVYRVRLKSLPGQTLRAEVIANNTLIRVKTPGGWRMFVIPKPLRTRFREQNARVLRRIGALRLPLPQPPGPHLPPG